MKMFIQTLLLIIIVLSLVYFIFYFAGHAFSPTTGFKNGSVCINENCFEVEVAATPKEREKGLMQRSFMDQDEGMFFVFDREGRYSFWMKNTLISLDIIWINSDNKIVFIEKNAQPCHGLTCLSIAPDQTAKYVLEINGGLSDKFGFKIGDETIIKLNK